MAKYDEVVMGLECCSKSDECGSHCPYNDEDDDIEGCTRKLASNALAMIRSLREQNDELSKENAKLFHTVSKVTDLENTITRLRSDKEHSIEKIQEAIQKTLDINIMLGLMIALAFISGDEW